MVPNLHMLLLLLAAAAMATCNSASYDTASSLKFNFYRKSCPQVESIVQERIAYWNSLDPTTPAPVSRLFFHDCFVYGCDASVLLNSSKTTQAEKDAAINFSIGDFFVLDDIKLRVEHVCPGVVSCADLLALCAVYSIKQAGGPLYKIELGRRDALTSFSGAPGVYLPAFNLTVDGLLENFAYHGLDVVDLVALSGGHTIGQGHCKSVSDRIFPRVDPTYHKGLGKELYENCTDDGKLKGGAYDQNVQYFLDQITSLIFDNAYYKALLEGVGLLTSDMSLVRDKRTRPLVELYAADQHAFFKQFGRSLRKMGKIGVLTGKQGQIRRQCWIRNPDNADFAFNPDPLLE